MMFIFVWQLEHRLLRLIVLYVRQYQDLMNLFKIVFNSNKKYIDDCSEFTCCYILYLQISSNMSSKSKKMRMNWEVPASKMSHQTFNPIRNIVDTMKLTPNPDKEMIALSIGKLYISYRQFKNVFYNKRCMHTALTTKHFFCWALCLQLNNIGGFFFHFSLTSSVFLQIMLNMLLHG